MTASRPGEDGSLAMLATPPSRKRVTPLTSMPCRWATSACANSWTRTETKSRTLATKATPQYVSGLQPGNEAGKKPVASPAVRKRRIRNQVGFTRTSMPKSRPILKPPVMTLTSRPSVLACAKSLYPAGSVR